MFENYTQDYLLSVMTDKAHELGFSATEGSLIYNASCLMAVMLEDAYDKAEKIYSNAFPDTCDREHLIRFARKKGIEPKAATKAVLKAVSNSFFTNGRQLTSNSLTYTVTEHVKYDEDEGGYIFIIECDTAGTVGNEITENLEPTEIINGFEFFRITEIITEGTDDEDTEVLRDRYFDCFAIQGQFGNRAYYINQAKSVAGVGAVKLSVDKNGNIEMDIVDTQGNAADDALVAKVERQVETAVGQVKNVYPAYEQAVNVSMMVKLKNGATEEDARAAIENMIDEYFKELSLTFGDVERLCIRLPIIQMQLFALDFVDNCEVYPFGENYSFYLPSGTIAKRGDVNVTFT
ncbi:MAG: baseplate J/gp47 family protein [Faecalibacterium sp.]|nr:baseplate J/gp47 family protein [Ruminococcus sp.]MCM1392115.1 baseplate J/gp47 family protein [Ruminococcus sp.]MCM1485812.1 baseplate J/gp47 family protein [Faecalibacterium sp.]